MECTKCKKRIVPGQKYHRTKRGPHHRDCSNVEGTPAVAVQRVVSRRRTGYNDKNGNPIREGDTVQTWMSAPWDEQVPIERTFKVEKEPGVGWMCKGELSNDEDDLLKNFKHLEIQKAKPANAGADLQPRRKE